MNVGGITQKIVDFGNTMFGHIRGGLGFANIGSSMIFAGISGTAIADTASVGGIMIPAMKKSGYDAEYACAITAASSTIGPIIPPSVPMIIAGTLTGISVGKLFVAGLIPGILIGVCLFVAMRAAGVCGSDVNIYHGTNAVATYPRVMGHEMVGVVDQVGSGVSKVKVGDRVIIDQVINCGECYACKQGRGNVCHILKVRGVHTHGGYREYMVVPEGDCYILPDNLSDEEAVMIEPATIAVQCLSRADAIEEDTVLILGCGALGTSILKIAKLTGATIIVADVFDEKLAMAKELGAHFTINIKSEDLVTRARELTGGYGPTVSIDAACTKQTLPLLLEVTGNAGRVITMGFSEELSAITQLKITSKELDVRGSRLQNKKFQTVLDLIRDNKLDLRGSISHTYNFLDAQRAFDLADKRDPSVQKIVLTF